MAWQEGASQGQELRHIEKGGNVTCRSCKGKRFKATENNLMLAGFHPISASKSTINQQKYNIEATPKTNHSVQRFKNQFMNIHLEM